MTDQCNPATFNAAVGPGTCIGDGTITFDHFIKEVTQAQKAGPWHFDPEDTTVEPGTALQLANRGGETHTFTKVANFGGGFVSPLNILSGNLVPKCNRRMARASQDHPDHFVGRILIGISVIFFGIEHFLHPYGLPGVPLAKHIPTWIPGRVLID